MLYDCTFESGLTQKDVIIARLTLTPPHQKLIAHRGASALCPENTLISMQTACSMGFNWIECDVQLTKDEQLVIFHDELLSRTSNGGAKALSQSTLETLTQYDYGAWKHKSFCNTPLLTLPILWDYANTVRLNLNLELKPYHNNAELAEIFIQFLQKNTSQFDILVSSFDHDLLRTVRRHCPSISIGFLVEVHQESVFQEVLSTPNCAYHLSATANAASTLKQLASNDIDILTYTVNHAKLAENLRDWGFWGIFTDSLLP